MKAPYLNLALKFTLLFLIVAFPFHVSGIKIKIKKPKITVGRPKITIPKPEQVIKDVSAAVKDATDDTIKTVSIAIKQTEDVIEKGSKDLVVEAGRVPGKVVDVGEALVAALSSKGQSALNEFEQAKRRVEEGKLADMLFHLALAPLKSDEEAAFKATQESGWVNSAGAVAAGAYGGPGGSAAYAAWQTYRLSGKNAELAIRAGIIAGLTKAAMSEVSAMESSEGSDLIKKAVLAGAIGGMAIAASGGNESDVQLGIIRGGAMVLIQDGYKNYVGQELDPKAATKPPYCIASDDPSCDEIRKAYSYDEKTKEWRYDPSKLDRAKSHVGIQTKVGTIKNPEYQPAKFGSDQSIILQTAGKIPAFNAMALFHDKWAVDWNMGTVMTATTIFPAIALTYIGTDAPLFTQIQSENVEKSQSKNLNSGGGSRKDPKSDSPPTSKGSEQITLWDALQAYQDSLPEEPKKPLDNIKKAITEHEKILESKTASVVSNNAGVQSMYGSIVSPLPDHEWIDPKNPSNFKTHKIEGIEVDKTGGIVPAPGWEWTNPQDPFNTEVRRMEGLELTKDGELQPKDGWEWADPNDVKNLKVVKVP